MRNTLPDRTRKLYKSREDMGLQIGLAIHFSNVSGRPADCIQRGMRAL
jgi:hypothetical protein